MAKVPSAAVAGAVDVLRVPIAPRHNLHDIARQCGFEFHTIDDELYWDESAYYQFSLNQIENDLEDPTAELHQMCLDLVDDVVKSDELMQRLSIPTQYRDAVAKSWRDGHPTLYGRMDFSYDGRSPAKLLEYNADTPTSLYEAGFFQWMWLENQVDAGKLSRASDQFNSIQEKLIARFTDLNSIPLTFSCCKDTAEDRGTVEYLEDCARQGGASTDFIFIEDLGINDQSQLVRLDDRPIQALFKLYPWEMMFEDEFGAYLKNCDNYFLEPMWKAILSNKGILPLLWQRHQGHPNLLPAWFADDSPEVSVDCVKKPLFGREGANISWLKQGQITQVSNDQGYGHEGYVIQQAQPLPQFDGNHTLIGSWIIANEPAGLTIREDKSAITQDTSRFIPHIILD
nr:glutathionylspermidine synthase family protein [Echinimonas agarilytica]